MRFSHLVPHSLRVALRPPLQCMGVLRPLNAFDTAVARRFKGKPCCVVQVGANDGKLGDPLYSWLVYARPWTRHWTGLLIEPIPYLFERLKANYASRQGITFLNAAIADAGGNLKLWSIRPDAQRDLNLSPYFEQLASADREHIVGHLGARIEPYLIDIDVPCYTLSEAMIQAGIERADILHVDAEGYDWRILSQIDFRSGAPSIVLYEHKHMTPDIRSRCRELFERNGYSVIEDGPDTVAELSECVSA